MAFLDRFASGARVMPDGDIAYASGRAGARWMVTNPTVGTAVTGPATAFGATTPMFSVDSANSDATTNPTTPGTRIIPSSLTLGQSGTVAGGTIIVIFGIDSARRYSSGGTALTPKQTNMEFAGTTGATVYQSPTLAAASGNIRYFQPLVIPAVVGSTVVINLGEGYSITKNQNFSVWIYAATTAPTLFYTLEWIEERAAQV